MKTRFFDESLIGYFLGWRSFPASVLQTHRGVSYTELRRFVESHLLTVLYCQANNTEAFDDVDDDDAESGQTRADVIEATLCGRMLECWNMHYLDFFFKT